MFLRILPKNGFLISTAFFILSAVFQVQAAVTVDSRTAGGAFSNTGVTTLSWTHTVGSGANRALYVGISTTNAAALAPVCPVVPCPTLTIQVGNPVISVTDNGTAMTRIGGFATALADTIVSTSIYRLVNPAPGANNIVVTFAPGVVTHAVGNSVSFFGVNQTTPNGFIQGDGGNNNTPSILVQGGATGDMVFDILASTPSAGFFAAGAGQTVCTDPATETTCTRGKRFFSTAYDIGASSTEPVATPPTTMSWTMTSNAVWALSAISITAAPPATAASSSISGQVRTADGRAIAFAHITAQNLETGEEFYTRTNQLGKYHIEGLESGKLYQVRIANSRYTFSPDNQIFNLFDSFTTVDFIGTSSTRRKKP